MTARTNAPRASDRARILVVEDDPHAGLLMKELLGLWGYDATLVIDSERALAAIDADSDYAAALIDLHGPKLDGRALAEAIRRRPDVGDLRLVAVTGRPLAVHELDDIPFDALLSKPVDPEALLRLLPALAVR